MYMWDSFESLIWWTLHIRQIHATIVDIFQPRWAHTRTRTHSRCIASNTLDLNCSISIEYFIISIRINCSHSLYYSWSLASRQAITESHFIYQPCTHTPKETFYDRILGIIWHFTRKVYIQIWDGNTSKAMASGEKRFLSFAASSFFPHPFNCRLQTMMSIFILYDYFSFYLLDFFLHSIPFICSQPFPSNTFRRCIFNSFLCMRREKKRIK